MSFWDGDVMVCVDCYFAHHYGYHEHEGKFYAGESDTPADCEPLSDLQGCELADNTCSNHELVKVGEDEFGDDLVKCDDCGSDDEFNGIDEFSMNRCDGCGSWLGGARYRLAYKVIEKETA